MSRPWHKVPDAFVESKLTETERRVYLCLLRLASTKPPRVVNIGPRGISRETGIDPAHVTRALKSLASSNDKRPALIRYSPGKNQHEASEIEIIEDPRLEGSAFAGAACDGGGDEGFDKEEWMQWVRASAAWVVDRVAAKFLCSVCEAGWWSPTNLIFPSYMPGSDKKVRIYVPDFMTEEEWNAGLEELVRQGMWVSLGEGLYEIPHLCDGCEDCCYEWPEEPERADSS